LALDNADSPGRLNFGKAGHYEVILTAGKTNDMVSKRELVFGAGGMIKFQPDTYAVIKKVFDQIQLLDQHSISLKEGN
jgi:hypothetical protein